MTDHDQIQGEDHETPADRNVHRLLSEAYVPEDPPAAFHDRERAALRSLASDLAKQRASSAPPPTTAPAEPAVIIRPDFGWRWALVAAVFLIGFALLLQLGRGPETPPQSDVSLKREGVVVWIDGKPYVPQVDAKTGEPTFVPQPSTGDSKVDSKVDTKPEPVNEPVLDGVKPREQAKQKLAPLIQTGQSLATDDGPRRVRLKDGSILYVDRNSSITVTGHRAVRLARGRVFVEVSPREGNDPGATFVVKTASRDVKALGTKFAVAADAARATAVLVTQGAVQVSGVAGPLRAGWKMSEGSAGKVEVAPLSRMSHELDWTRELIRESETPLVPGSKHAGGALIAVDPYGQETKLTLRDYKVDVRIEDGFARTTMDQTYFNHEYWRMEGTFYFPLPPGASISRLAMYVNGKRMEGGMAERDHARSVFEQIRHTRRDPALLEWLDGSTFKMRVFPLEGRQEKRIVLSYVQRLESAYGKTTYRFPSGHSLGVVGKLGYRVRVAGHGERGWASPSHDLVAAPAAGDLELALERKQALMKDDLVVQLDDPTTKAAQRPRWTQIVHEGQRYLMLRTRPDLKGTASKAPAAKKKTFLFLFESSGDRDPLLARTQVEVVKTFLDNAEHSDEFTVLTAGTRVRAFSAKPRPVVPSVVREATAFLDRTHLIGALDLGQAFAALEPLVAAAKMRGREPVVVHVGSGIPALQEREQQKLVAAVPGGARYVGVGVGKRWGRSLMKAAAAKTGGVYARINPDEEVRWRAYEVFSLLRTPTLTDLTIQVPGSKQTEFLLADEVVHHGGEVCAVTRLPAAAPLPKQLVITGKRDGQAFSETIPVADVTPKAGYLPRFWALLQLDRLIANGATKNKQAIVKLSKQSYVMSPFTSLLVLETEAMYKQFKVDRGRSDHWAAYACPKTIKVVHEPGERGPVATTTPGERAPRKKVLDTLMVRLAAAILSDPHNPYAGQRRLLTVNQLLAGGAQGVGWLNNTWGGASTWTYRYFDPSGRLGMNRWARRNGLVPGQQQLQTKTRSLISGDKARDARFLPMGRPFSTTSLKSEARVSLLRAGELASGFQLQVDSPMIVFSSANPVDASVMDSLDMSLRIEPSNRGLFSDVLRVDGLRRLERGRYNPYYQAQSPLFRAPRFTHNLQAAVDLLAFAPALNTCRDDVAAVLRAEARLDPQAGSGKLDPRAAALIAQARNADWTAIQIPAGAWGAAFRLVFDGRGRFAWERVNASGLREVVACDGKTLLHAYPELSLAARRVWSPEHQVRLQRWAPWALAPASELARGHDVTMSGPRTVAITPRAVDRKKPYRQLELVFGADGLLATRRRVRIDPGKGRTVEALTNLATLRTQRKAAPAPAPNLKPATRDLIVLPLPFRSPAQAKAHLIAKIGQKAFHKSVSTWSEEDALTWAAAHINNPHKILQIARQRFSKQPARRAGLHVLVLAAGGHWNDADRLSRFSADLGPVTHLELFLDGSRRMFQRWNWHSLFNRSVKAFDGAPAPIRDMARLQHVLAGYQSGRLRRGKTSAQQRALGLQILGWAEECRDPKIAWALTQLLTQQSLLPRNDARLVKGLQQVYARCTDHPQLGYAARYLQAQNLALAGKRPEARKQFKKLYAETLARGGVPRIDHQFVATLNHDDAGGFTGFVRKTARSLAKANRHSELPGLAWQCWQLSQRPASTEVLDTALGQLPSEQMTATLLKAVRVLWRTNQLPRAARVLERLQRSQAEVADRVDVWRMVSAVALKRGRSAKAVDALERALDLQYAKLPDVINLQTVRTDYGQLLGQYLTVANALSALEQKPPHRFIARVVRAADRWRAIDPNPTQACQLAAQILQTLDAKDLAWEYLTTPVAKSPNEAAPWVNLAKLARTWDDLDLVDRSYTNAFAAEETNAQILWDHAQVLQQGGQTSKAQALYRKLAEGKWQPRFRWIQQQAKQYLGG